MIESAQGIILRTRPLTETSLIVHWLTRERGRLATVAKGARRPKSPFRGRLDLFYEAEFSFHRSRRSDLHLLREVRVETSHAALRADLSKLRQAAYAVAFIEQTTETETPLPEIFELLRGFLSCLDAYPPQPQNIFALELKLLRELGLAPNLAETSLTAEARKIAQGLLAEDWTGVARWSVSPARAAELRQFLHGFLIFHLGSLPRGRAGALAGGQTSSQFVSRLDSA
jgi:DNA repair protein RecO (recombination protein O)